MLAPSLDEGSCAHKGHERREEEKDQKKKELLPRWIDRGSHSRQKERLSAQG